MSLLYPETHFTRPVNRHFLIEVNQLLQYEPEIPFMGVYLEQHRSLYVNTLTILITARE